MTTIKTTADISILKESSELECKLAQGRDGKGAIPKDMWEIYSAFANNSGLPKIKQGWIAQGHSLELYDNNTPYNQTIIELNWYVPEEMSDTSEGAESSIESRPESIINRVLLSLVDNEYSKSQIAEAIGHKSISRKLNQRIRGLLSEGLVEYTISGKPNSRLQKYRLTDAGRKYLEMSIGSENGLLKRE